MNLQTAVKVCQKTRQNTTPLYARPCSWKDQGRAVDLGRTMGTPTIKVVSPIGDKGAVCGSDWKCLPEELLEDWELVGNSELYKEMQHEPIPAKGEPQEVSL